jgi:hypothetical protein
MRLFDGIFKQKTFDARLQGTWLSDLDDELTRKSIGNVSMTFTPDGNLYYDILDVDKAQRINLVDWTTDNVLYTDQPSHPRKEKTNFDVPSPDDLILDFGGQKSKFERKSH